MRLPGLGAQISAQPDLSEELMALLGGQDRSPQIAIPNAPIPLRSLGPSEKEQRQADLARELFDLSRQLKMNPDQSEAMDLIAAAFERFGRSL